MRAILEGGEGRIGGGGVEKGLVAGCQNLGGGGGGSVLCLKMGCSALGLKMGRSAGTPPPKMGLSALGLKMGRSAEPQNGVQCYV